MRHFHVAGAWVYSLQGTWTCNERQSEIAVTKYERDNDLRSSSRTAVSVSRRESSPTVIKAKDLYNAFKIWAKSEGAYIPRLVSSISEMERHPSGSTGNRPRAAMQPQSEIEGGATINISNLFRQYHFDRDDFVKCSEKVFTDDEIIDTYNVRLSTEQSTTSLLYRWEDEFYIIHRDSGHDYQLV